MVPAKGDKYDLAEPDLKSFARSTIRTKVMLTLLEGSKTIGELERRMNTRSTTILHSIKSLMESRLVEKKQLGYSLTNIGKIQAILLDELVDTIVTINENQDFWLLHDLSGIPLELQKRIGMLGQGEIIKDAPETPLKSLDYFIATLSDSKEIRGVSPVLLTGYPEAIAHVVKNGAFVELILTKPVLNATIVEQKELLKELLDTDNFKLYSIEADLNISFTVTESFLNLGLSRIDGSYDLGADLVYCVESAIIWGNMLFDHYRHLSKNVAKCDIN
ncbi:MAG TPA: winged helix-turn-helix domain-containing protein [Methanothrix sp.]|nr:winged helix-turn-helix domain-containing protein [Methanothrix sp.]